MAIMDNRKDLSEDIIEEYLTAAKACLDTPRPDGSILGYPAALLLLCTTDAIGHGVLTDNGRDTRLDVLTNPPFGLTLKPTQIENLTKWYRHLLAHTATMAPGAFLKPDTQGKPFDFDASDALTIIRVPVLYEVVEAAWKRRDKSAFCPPPPRARTLPDQLAQPPGFASSLSTAASGSFKP